MGGEVEAIISVRWWRIVLIVSAHVVVVGLMLLATWIALSPLTHADAVSPVTQVVPVAINDSQGVLGSGFTVGSCLFTNDHVLASAEGGSGSLAATDGVSPLVLGESTYRDSAADIAIVSLLPPGSSVNGGVVLGAAEIEAGDVAAIVGFRPGVGLEAREARVATKTSGTAYGIAGPVVLLEGVSTAGYSGGPVISADGHLIAMITGFDHATNLIIAIPASSLADAMEQSVVDCR